MSPTLEFQSGELKKAALVFRAVNHKLRQQILHLLHERQGMIVSQIYGHLCIEQSVASTHLAILRRAGIVQTKREGKKIYYTVNHSRLIQLHALAKEIVNGS